MLPISDYATLQSEGLQSGGLQSKGLHSGSYSLRSTSPVPLVLFSGEYLFGGLQSAGIQSGGLQSGGPQSEIHDFCATEIGFWNSVACVPRVWELTVWSLLSGASMRFMSPVSPTPALESTCRWALVWGHKI